MKRRQFVHLATASGVGIGFVKQGLAVDLTSEPNTIREEARNIPIIDQADICVLGGSCTGVFAAIRAARLGAKVIIIEKQNAFGGSATSSMVNVWHSLYDTEFKQPIIAGLTLEVMERLKKRKASRTFDNSPSRAFDFNSEELKIELDEMIREAKVTPYFHTAFSSPVVQDQKLTAVIVENKSGRGAIQATMFIDATGDGDLCFRLGIPTYTQEQLQPPTTCMRLEGWDSLQGVDLNKILLEHGPEYDLPEGFSWGTDVPDSSIYMLAGTRVYGVNCADASDLTRAEIEGRRQVRAILDIVRRYAPQCHLSLQALPSQIGIRETRHIRTEYQLTGDDVLSGRRFDDAIANGSYRVDIHHQDKPGITFRYLDGTERYERPGYPSQKSRWREETATDPTFYQIPYRCLVPGFYGNLLLAGRMLDADPVAFSAVRVMVNMNQTGEAAGVACALGLNTPPRPLVDLKPQLIREELERGGSIIL